MLKGRFWWPGMRTDCEKFAKACQVCVHTRKPRMNVPPLQPIVSTAPWELLCMDLLQLPQSFEGFKYALICIDHFSKYAIVHPVPNKTAEAVASVLMKDVFLIYGPCKRIHSDLGGEFCNKVVSQLRDVFGMGQTTTAGYNPRCNGVAERMGRQVIKMLTQTLPIPQGWVERLPFVLFVYNVSPHEETGESPFFLQFARDVNFPTEIDEALLPTPYSVDIDDFRAIMMQNLGNAVENVQRALQRSRERAKKYYDARHRVNPNKYQVGQRVMVFDPSIGTAAATKLHWRFFGPFRISAITDNNAKVYPIDKPHAEPQLVPLDRLSPVPVEVPNFSYARRPDRARIVSSCTLASMLPQPFPSEIDVRFELMSTPSTVTEHIVLRKADGDAPKHTFESKEKRVLLVRLIDECGLGPYWPCSGTCTDRCRPVLVRDALPTLQGQGEAELKVPTFAHAVYISQLKRYADEAEQPALVRKILDKDASVLNREFYGLFDGTDVEPPSFDALLAQAHLRKERCYRARRALELNPWVPIKCFGDNAEDHRDFTSTLYSSSTLSHPMIGADKLGPVWERVRYSGGRKVVSGPFLALSPPGDESLFVSGIIKIVSVKDLRATNCELRDAVYDGTVQAIIIGLPPPAKEDPERLQAIIDVLDFGGFEHVQVIIIPPPPTYHTSYGAVLEQLTRLPGLSLAKATDSGRSLLEIGRIGNGFDKRVVEKEGPRQGHWTHFGREMLRSYIVDVAGVEWMRRPSMPPPPRPPAPPVVQHRLASVVSVVPQGAPHSFRAPGGNVSRRRAADEGSDSQRGPAQHRSNYCVDKRRRN